MSCDGLTLMGACSARCPLIRRSWSVSAALASALREKRDLCPPPLPGARRSALLRRWSRRRNPTCGQRARLPALPGSLATLTALLATRRRPRSPRAPGRISRAGGDAGAWRSVASSQRDAAAHSESDAPHDLHAFAAWSYATRGDWNLPAIRRQPCGFPPAASSSPSREPSLGLARVHQLHVDPPSWSIERMNPMVIGQITVLESPTAGSCGSCQGRYLGRLWRLSRGGHL